MCVNYARLLSADGMFAVAHKSTERHATVRNEIRNQNTNRTEMRPRNHRRIRIEISVQFAHLLHAHSPSDQSNPQVATGSVFMCAVL